MNTQNFIDLVSPGAKSAMNKSRIIASLSVAQAALESGWGAHAPGNALFGIKATSGWTGKTQQLKTTEYINGIAKTVTDVFRAYSSWADSIADHAAFITQNSRYVNILGVADYKTVCSRIAADGYATDPDYAQQLTDLIQEYGLYNLDKLPSITTIDKIEVDPDTGNVTVSGWAVNMSGLARVDIYYDGAHGLASVRSFTGRPDVQKAVNGSGWYPGGARFGFTAAIPANMVPDGKHTFGVAGIGVDGSVQWAHKDATVTAPVPAPLICLDSPAEGSAIGADLLVKGWGIAGTGIDRIDLYADSDNKGLASVQAFTERPDVDKIENPHGLYKDALHSGFAVTIPASLLGKGKHTINAVVIAKDGRKAYASRNITIN